jgi:hypothetical protein
MNLHLSVLTDNAASNRTGAAIMLRIWLLMICSSCAAHASDAWKPLWNGRDFAGWTSWLKATEAAPGTARGSYGKLPTLMATDGDPRGVFSVVSIDGHPAIRVSGEVLGELRSTAVLQNYHLRLQFKWGHLQWPPLDKPGMPRDSGLLYHVHSSPGVEGRLWPRSIEFQVQERDVGDLYSIGSMIFVRSKLRTGVDNSVTPAFCYDPESDWNCFSQVPGMVGRCIKQSDHEKPSGEWNTLELICLGAESLHIVNGVVVMRLHIPTRLDSDIPKPVISGPIALQSECAEIFYRAMEYRPISAIPVEYAAK